MTTNEGEASTTLDDEVAALFRLPLADFTPARNALAARLKKEKRRDEAERVKTLAKPSMTAWTVNQLYWRHRAPFDRLIAIGDRFRAALTAQLAGQAADLRSPVEARREALAELGELAAVLLEEAGHNAAPDTMRRIAATLEALATYGSLPGGPRPGVLSADVDPPGFETLAALVGVGEPPAADDGGTRVLPFRRPTRAGKAKTGVPPAEDEAARKQADQARVAARAAAQTALAEAEQALDEARGAAKSARSAQQKADAQLGKAEADEQEAERRYREASAAAEEARRGAGAAGAQAAVASRALEEAELAVAQAKRSLEELGSADA